MIEESFDPVIKKPITVHIERYMGPHPIYQVNPDSFRFEVTPYREDWRPELKPVIDSQLANYNKLRPADEKQRYAELDEKLAGFELSGYDWEKWEQAEQTIAVGKIGYLPESQLAEVSEKIHQQIIDRKKDLFAYIRKYPIDSLRYFRRRQAYSAQQLDQANKSKNIAAIPQLKVQEKFFSDEVSFVQRFIQANEPHASLSSYYQRLRKRVLEEVEKEKGDPRTISIHFLRALDDVIEMHRARIPNDGAGQIIGAATLASSYGADHSIDKRKFTTKGRPN